MLKHFMSSIALFPSAFLPIFTVLIFCNGLDLSYSYDILGEEELSENYSIFLSYQQTMHDLSLFDVQCPENLYGDFCDFVTLSDSDVLDSVKIVLEYSLETYVDISVIELETIISLSVPCQVSSFAGLEYASNLTSLSVIGGCTDYSCSIFTQSLLDDLVVTVPFLSELILDGIMTVASDLDFSGFSSLTSLSIINETPFDMSSSELFPSSLSSLDLSGCADFDYASDLSVLCVLTLTSLTMNDLAIPSTVSFSAFSSLTHLSLSNSLSDSLSLLSTAGTFPVDTLTSLILDNNSISDISVLVTSGEFDSDPTILTYLSFSNNLVCDIVNTVSDLQAYFTNLSVPSASSSVSSQTCPCSVSVSFDGHRVCRELYPNHWFLECWNGYYYDEEQRLCVEDVYYVCPPIPDEYHKCVFEDYAPHPSLGCRSAWYGDDCDQLYQVYIPDEMFRKFICSESDYYSSFELCDISPFEMATISSLDMSGGSEYSIFSLEGIQYLINAYYIHILNENAVYSLAPISSLKQVSHLWVRRLSSKALSYSSWKSFSLLSRFFDIKFLMLEPLYDISIIYRSTALYQFHPANNEVSDPFLIPICRSESDDDFWDYINFVFRAFNAHSHEKTAYTVPNACPINDNPGEMPFSCNPSIQNCPSIVLNEVYNSVADPPVKQCAFIAKEGINGECFTVHDDYVRQYLKDYCLSESDVETNGIISVGTMRTKLTCSSLSLSDVVTNSSASISSVDEITTLQGLEYAQGVALDDSFIGLTSLNVDGYDLSGTFNQSRAERAENDKLVVQLLAKSVDHRGTWSNRQLISGLTSLSAQNCRISYIEDILDITPILDQDETTKPFKLTNIDVSHNSISDVSVLITSSMFPDDTLTNLNIGDNAICDIEGIVGELLSKFTNLQPSLLIYSNQKTCPCSASVFSSTHQVCRKVYPDHWAVECWNGYYLEKSSGKCREGCSSGYELDTSGTSHSCTSTSAPVDDTIRLQVCESHSNVKAVLEIGASSITCGCRSGFHGDSCEYLDIADSNLRSALCMAVSNPSAHVSSCDDLTLSDMATVTSVHASIVDSFEGLQHAVNMTSLSISGTSSSSVSIGNTDLGYLPLSLVELSLEAVYLDADSDFSIFPNLTTLSLKNNSSYDLTNSALFPSSSSSSSSSFTCLDVSYTALSSFSSIPTSITTLTANNCSSLTSFSTISNLTNLVSLDVSYASNVSDFSSLLSNIPLSISILYADGCNVAANTDFSTFTALTTLSLNDNTDYDITESGLFPSPSSLTSFSANNTSISLLFHLVASMPNLTDLSLNNNNISDPSPLYALSSSGSWSSLDLSYNHICGDNGDTAIETFLASKFSLSTADVNASGQACICSSDDLGSNPLDVNKVCAETKPGVSNTWYVVCASDSYTSYTDASTFACISPDNGDGTFGCSGGCEYGQECRYDSTSTSTSCQQVIVDENLHACVADMFVDSVGDPAYTHRTDSTPSLFSVASLKTLESVDDGSGVYSP
ncbi:Acidic leucine-rich nuclear phosphoprotein 32 like protein, partial [Aduncisulcus paluster]